MLDIEKAKNGDELAIEKVINECSPMLKALCRQFFLTGLDGDDLMQEAMLGLINAINNYDKSKNDSFKGFAYVCAQRKLLSVYRAQSRQKACLLNSTLGIDNEGALVNGTDTGLIVAVSEDDFVSKIMDREQNHAQTIVIKTLLKPNDYNILKKYLAGYKYDEIAQDMHITSKNVDNRLQAIKKILLKNKDKIIKGE